MKKIVFSVLSLGVLGTANAQTAVTDTVVTGAGYVNQKYYSLANDEQATANATAWHVAVAPGVLATDGALRFNSLAGTVKIIPNATAETAITAVDTAGWAAETALYDKDFDYLTGAFNQSANSSNQFDYSWAAYDQGTHSLLSLRTFGAKIGSDFYLLRVNANYLGSGQFNYDVISFKVGATDSVKTTITSEDYKTKNFVYFNLDTKAVLDLEPATADWDLFFGQYKTDLGGGQIYSVAGVLNNIGTQVARVITTDPAGYAYTGEETFATENNVIHYDVWKKSGQGGTTIADTVVFVVKAKDGAIWKVQFTGFISGAGGGTGEYIFDKTLVSAVGVNNVTAVYAEIYPNPANDNLQIVVDAVENTTIDIYSLTGAKVYSTTANGGLQTLHVNTAELMNGVYQVVVTSNGLQTTKKLVVQH